MATGRLLMYAGHLATGSNETVTKALSAGPWEDSAVFWYVVSLASVSTAALTGSCIGSGRPVRYLPRHRGQDRRVDRQHFAESQVWAPIKCQA